MRYLDILIKSLWFHWIMGTWITVYSVSLVLDGNLKVVLSVWCGGVIIGLLIARVINEVVDK